jgi:hypothetical protein
VAKVMLHPGIDKVEVIWECEWNKKIEEDSILQTFISKTYFWPCGRLCVRDCVRGGLNECINLFWSKKKYPNTNLYYQDINSYYPSIAIDMEFPTNKPTYYLSHEMSKNVKIIQNNVKEPWNNTILVNGKEVFGCLQVTVLFSQTEKEFEGLLQPLPTQMGEKNICANCYTCGKKKQKKPCNHTDQERVFTSVYLSNELLYAMRNANVKVMAIHEIIHYTSRAKIFDPFMKLLARDKLRSSGIPKKYKTIAESQKFVDFLNLEHKLTGLLALQISDMEFNPILKELAKNRQNSIIGRFAYAMPDSGIQICSSRSDMLNLQLQNVDINGINELSSGCLLVNYVNKYKPDVSLSSNSIINGLVCAEGRIRLWGHMKTLFNQGAVIMGCDTDSITYYLDSNIVPNVPMDEFKYGSFKNELKSEQIESFHSLGIKNYCITYKEDNVNKVILKVKGLCIKEDIKKELSEKYPGLIEARMKNIQKEIAVQQETFLPLKKIIKIVRFYLRFY